MNTQFEHNWIDFLCSPCLLHNTLMRHVAALQSHTRCSGQVGRDCGCIAEMLLSLSIETMMAELCIYIRCASVLLRTRYV